MATMTKKRRDPSTAKAIGAVRRKRGGERVHANGQHRAARKSKSGVIPDVNEGSLAGLAAGECSGATDMPTASRKNKRRSIAPLKKSPRVNGAAGEFSPDTVLSGASQNQNGSASGRLSPENQMPIHATGEGDGPVVNESRGADACRQISELQRIRIAVLKSRQAIDNRLRATVATVMGYHAGLDPEARKAAHAKAQEFIDCIAAGSVPCSPNGDLAASSPDRRLKERPASGSKQDAIGDGCEPVSEIGCVASRVSDIVINTGIARAGFQAFLSNLETEMQKLAKSLPVAEWVKSVRGFGLLNLAIIVGECGDLSNYAGPAKVWRRMGCAPFNGKMGSTWKRKGGLSAEQWTEYGYCQRRRAIAFCLADCLIKSNDGEYRKRYDDVKAAKLATNDEAWPKLRCHLHASLLTAKRALRDLWKQWHKK